MRHTIRNLAILVVGCHLLIPGAVFAGIEEHSPDPVPEFAMFDDMILFDPDKAAERAAELDEDGREDDRENEPTAILCPSCLDVQPAFADLELTWRFAEWGIEYLARPEQVVLTSGDDWESPELLDDTETRSASNPHHQKRRERRDEDQKPSLKSSLGRFEAELETDGDSEEVPDGGCSAHTASPSSSWHWFGVWLFGLAVIRGRAHLAKS